MYNLNRKHVNMYELINCLTDAADLANPRLTNHHQETAYMAYHIAEHMGLSIKEQQEVVLAGLLHDIGAVSTAERISIIDNDESDNVHEHATKGADILDGFSYLKNAANIIRYHHVKWENGKGSKYEGKEVPLLSNILYLADRAVVQLDKNMPIIGQINRIKDEILKQKGLKFRPEAVDAFLCLADKEYIWLDISYKRLYSTMKKMLLFDTLDLEIEEVTELTRIFARVIDMRSPFTASHSAGVAQTAFKLAEFAGFSENECKMMLVAGYVHDLGKLVVGNDILEKNDKLTKDEFNIVKTHTYYTYRILETIEGWDTVNEWASFHHERLNGKGYPFHLSAGSLSLGSRIMAVADIFTAITEDRPYRKGMDKTQALRVLTDMVKTGSICGIVVSMLADNYDLINSWRIKAQGNNS